MGKLFGTDGVRGVANVELTPELAFDLGRVGAYVLGERSGHVSGVRILIGRDTRRSGEMLEAAMMAGISSMGAQATLTGVIPSPTVAYLTRSLGYSAGVMISASHNPFADNGIKFFDSEGYKLNDSIEEEIEEIIYNKDKLNSLPRPSGAEIPHRHEDYALVRSYIDYLKTTIEEDSLEGLNIALDCANGATYYAAPTLFSELGANVMVMHNTPDGININEKCGSTHMEDLIEFVKKHHCDCGFAFDGDGDRCLAVTGDGVVVDGDEIMSICGKELMEQGKLKQNTIVATVMSNLGFFIMGRESGINIEQTAVGDRYVLERMLEKGYNLGGEPSGHVIFLDHNTTGDGVMTALKLSASMKRSGKNLAELNTCMTKLPQVLVNARVQNTHKYDYMDNENIKQEIALLEEKFAGNGRVLIRPSGTEPKVRVMIEGQDLQEITDEANRIARLLEKELNK